MTHDEYLERKQSGELTNVDDAGQQDDAQDEPIDTEEESETLDNFDDNGSDEQEDVAELPDDSEDEELPPLSEKEKTAFQKRLEREQTKLREKLEAELKEQYEQQYGKHKKVLESLGGDPDAILQRIEENNMLAEARRLADANGWDDEQTQWYVQDQRNKMEQQKQQRELQELRVQMQINRLRDNPDYTGIGAMEKDILAKIDRTNGALSVEEAYWALGGHKRAEQIRLEAQMREQVKRQKQPRTVLTDSPTSTTGEKPLPPETLREAERMGISAAEARRLMSAPPAKDLSDWRAQRQKQKK